MTDFSPLGAFEEQILVAVFRSRDDAFGMQVRREIERVTGRELAIGAVYATLDRLEPASRRAWPLVALAVARPALRAMRLAIVETIRVADLLVFRNYGVQRLAHFTGAERIHGLRWTSDAVTAGHVVARLASREVAALRHRG